MPCGCGRSTSATFGFRPGRPRGAARPRPREGWGGTRSLVVLPRRGAARAGAGAGAATRAAAAVARVAAAAARQRRRHRRRRLRLHPRHPLAPRSTRAWRRPWRRNGLIEGQRERAPLAATTATLHWGALHVLTRVGVWECKQASKGEGNSRKKGGEGSRDRRRRRRRAPSITRRPTRHHHHHQRPAATQTWRPG